MWLEREAALLIGLHLLPSRGCATVGLMSPSELTVSGVIKTIIAKGGQTS